MKNNFERETPNAFTNEEKRVLYVGLTRAQSTLIVSHIKNRANIECHEFTLMKKLDYEFAELNSKNIYFLSKAESKENK